MQKRGSQNCLKNFKNLLNFIFGQKCFFFYFSHEKNCSAPLGNCNFGFDSKSTFSWANDRLWMRKSWKKNSSRSISQNFKKAWLSIASRSHSNWLSMRDYEKVMRHRCRLGWKHAHPMTQDFFRRSQTHDYSVRTNINSKDKFPGSHRP